MERSPGDTRTLIMDTAQGLILEHGFAATSVDAIVGRAGVTKGAFFHHFPTKMALARALLERYAALDLQVLTTTMDRAERLSRDPLQQLLIFVALLEEMWEGMEEPFPGCLFASYVYEAQLLNEESHRLIQHSIAEWRRALGEKLRAAARRQPPRAPLDADHAADLLTVILEGTFVVSRAMGDGRTVEGGWVVGQLRQYRSYLELLFGLEGEPEDGARAAAGAGRAG